jgi:hypothetical protein
MRCMHRSPDLVNNWACFRDELHFQIVREDDLKEIAVKFQEAGFLFSN